MEVKIYSKDGAEVGTVALNDTVFGIEPRAELVHQYVVNYLANQRQGNSSSKNRAAVNGGGSKPWRQKGTGRARAGSRSSPLWRGGGIIFGPHPKNYSVNMPKKIRRSAFRSALSAKAAEKGAVLVVQEMVFEKPATRLMAELLDKQLPGIMEHIRTTFGADKPNALLSRGIAGVMGRTLVYTLPGSVRAVQEYMGEILKSFEHVMLTLYGLCPH